MQKKHLISRRMLTHLVLGGSVALLYETINDLFPSRRYDLWIVALGYASLVLICLSLSIGTCYLLHQRRNPVNLDMRRDIGIWAGITGGWHVVLVLRGIVPSGQLPFYFLRETSSGGYTLQLSLFGISNDLGLLALLLLTLLSVLSNTASLRWLKGRRWKQIQRLTYPLLLLAVGHTLGYQYFNLRGPLLLIFVLCLVVLVCLAQGWGIALMVSRRKH
jgi:sulfoxide reductase heme-binding subunit YedZ